jgi:hypothetical protein
MHAVSMSPHAKYDTACTIENDSKGPKKALERESGAQGVLCDEKKPTVENLVTLYL